MTEYRDISTRLRESSKRTDLPNGLPSLLSEAYAEIEDLRARIERLREGFEGSCTACEPVGEMNRRLLSERDEARREICGHSYDDPRGVARDRGWDCYKENTNGK